MRVNDGNAAPPLHEASQENVLQDYVRAALEKQQRKRSRNEETSRQCNVNAALDTFHSSNAPRQAPMPLQQQQEQQDENLFHASTNDLALLDGKSVATSESAEPLQQQHNPGFQEYSHHPALLDNQEGATSSSTGLDFLANAVDMSTHSSSLSLRRVSDAHGRNETSNAFPFGSSNSSFLFGSSTTTNGNHRQGSIRNQELTAYYSSRRVSDAHGRNVSSSFLFGSSNANTTTKGNRQYQGYQATENTGQEARQVGRVNPISFPSRGTASLESSSKELPRPGSLEISPFSFPSTPTAKGGSRSKQQQQRHRHGDMFFFENDEPRVSANKPRRVSNDNGRHFDKRGEGLESRGDDGGTATNNDTARAAMDISSEKQPQGGIVYNDDCTRLSSKPRRVSNDNGHGLENGAVESSQDNAHGKVLANKNTSAADNQAKENPKGNTEVNQARLSAASAVEKSSTNDGHCLEESTAGGTVTAAGATNPPATTGDDLGYTSPFVDDSDAEQAVFQAIDQLVASSEKKNVGTDEEELVDLTRSSSHKKDRHMETQGVVIQASTQPDTGKFGSSTPASHNSLLDSSSDDDDSSENVVLETRKIRSKSVIQDDILESSPEKKGSALDGSDLDESPAFTGTPRSISPFDDTDDDSNTSTPKRTNKKKTKRLKKSPSSSTKSENDTSGNRGPNKKRKKKRKRSQEDRLSDNEAATARQPSRKQGRKKLTASKSTGGAKKTFQGHNVGERVYAEWAKNDWYWGRITSVKRKKGSQYDHYSILFDDGDTLDSLSRKSIFSASRYRSYFGQEPPPLPDPLPSLTPQELYYRRCRRCDLCKRPDCGKCNTCRRNKERSSSDKEMEVCLQKMCLEIPDEEKRQPAHGLLPHWTFVFKENRPYYKGNNAHVPGLYIFPDNPSVTYRSVEAAISNVPKKLLDYNPNAVSDFYRFVGVKSVTETEGSSSQTKSKKVPSRNAAVKRKKASSAPMSLEELFENRCGECVNCNKEDCGECFSCLSCLSNTDGSQRQKVCLQKMCCRVEVDLKAQPMPPEANFPDKGWRFIIDETRKGYKINAGLAPPWKGAYGLKILSPKGTEYYSVERAKSSSSVALKGVSVNAFYVHIGAKMALSQKSSVPEPVQRGTSLSEYLLVGARVCCTEGKEGRWGTITEKFEVSEGDYVFSVRMEDDQSLLEDIGMGNILSEIRYKSKTGMDPPPPPQQAQRREGLEYDSDDFEERPNKKQKVGSSTAVKMVPSTDHFLIGRKLFFSWTDLKNQSKVVYGTVVECEKNAENGNVHRFKVLYNKCSRDTANSVSNGCSSVIPETQMIQPSLVVGGCVQYEKMLQSASRSALLEMSRLHSWNWITPDLRHEELLENRDGTLLPRLTLAIRGFKLELNVKPSTISNAGLGVFLSCVPLMNPEDCGDLVMQPFELHAGELVDLGAYGPFRRQDRKLEAVFFAKNFVHSHKCEEWAFDAGDSRYQLDITDEVTGNIHDAAMSHIPAFVNESEVDENVCIHAEHDPEGSVHYLLGHKEKSQGSFVLPPDGTELEIFVNYGAGYELVRVRKGYSFLSDDERDKKKHLLKVIAHEDIVDVKEMDQFGAAEVEATVDYFFGLFTKESETRFSKSVVQRALVVAVVLQNRTLQLFTNEKTDDSNGDSSSNTVNMLKVLKLSAELVSLLLDMVRDEGDRLKELNAAGDVDGLLESVLKMQFSRKELANLKGLMK